LNNKADFFSSIEESINNVYDRINNRYSHHIFQGDFNKYGKPTGFHSQIEGSKTHEVYGKITLVDSKYGIYQQSVRSVEKINGEKVKKDLQSTFFPKNMTHKDIIRGIISVFVLKNSHVNYTEDPQFNGMPLTKKGNSIYPSGGNDLPAE